MVFQLPRRIAILTNYPADLKSFAGGVETATAGLLDGLKRYQADYEFHIIALSKMVNKDLVISHNGFKFHFLAVPKSPFFKPHLPYNIIKTLLKIKALNPDLVHCHDNMALAVAALMSGYPRIFTVHGIKRLEAKFWRGKEYLSHQMDRILEWFVHRKFHHFVAISPYVAGILGKKKKIFNIPNPLPREIFNAEDNKIKRFNNQDTKDILFVGPLVYLKQVHILIEAWIELNREFGNLRLTICGLMEDEKYFREILKRLKENNSLNNVNFKGQLSRKEMILCLKRAFALVLPSLQENSPMIICEAMALGTPVIASRVGGIPYMIEHRKTGLLFNCGDSCSLEESIKLLLKNNTLRKRIIRTAQDYAKKNYDPGKIAEKTIGVYNLLARRNICGG